MCMSHLLPDREKCPSSGGEAEPDATDLQSRTRSSKARPGRATDATTIQLLAAKPGWGECARATFFRIGKGAPHQVGRQSPTLKGYSSELLVTVLCHDSAFALTNSATLCRVVCGPAAPGRERPSENVDAPGRVSLYVTTCNNM